MGKRENRQITMFDAVVIVILGDLIGTPTIDFQLPIVLAMLALGVFLAIERGFIILIQHSQRLEDLIESKPALIIEDCKVNFRVLHKEKLGVNELYSSLRVKGIDNLGFVKRAYLEGSGDISVFKNKPPEEGLSILPPMMGGPTHYSISSVVIENANYFCWHCGEGRYFHKDAKFTSCPRCQGKEWVSEDHQERNS